MSLDAARHDAAVLALLQARTRLDTLTRVLRPVAPLVNAVEHLLPDTK